MNKIFILLIICLLLITTITCTYFDPFSAAGVPSLFWVDEKKQIFRMPAENPEELRDFNLEPFPSDFWEVTAMALDPVMGTMYLGIVGENSSGIYRANYNGTGVEMIISTNHAVYGIAIHFYERELYWSEDTWIRKAYLGEFDKVTAEFDTGIYITDLEIDMVSNTLYFVDGSNFYYSSSAMGESPLSITLTPAGALAEKIELSLFDNKIFWFNQTDQSIYYSDVFTGGNEVMLSPPNLPSLIDFSLDIETGNLYWADNSGVYRIRTDGSEPEQQVMDRIDLRQFAGDFMNARQY